MKQGIYSIRNIVNGRIYVGSAINIQRRLNHHFYLLRRGIHHSPALQSAYTKNPERFESTTLEEVASPNDLIAREQFWIDSLSAYGRGYNGKPLAGKTQLGRKHSEAARAKMSAAKIGKPSPRKGQSLSEELRRRCGYNKGKKMSDAFREKLRIANTGRRFTAETRSKISASLKGRGLGVAMRPEIAAKISASLLGRKKSAEHSANISKGRRKMFADQVRP